MAEEMEDVVAAAESGNIIENSVSILLNDHNSETAVKTAQTSTVAQGQNGCSEQGLEPSVEQLSKSQLKKRKRKEAWEEGREQRKVRRKEKTKQKKERKRAALDSVGDPPPTNEVNLPGAVHGSIKDSDTVKKRTAPQRSVQLPITFVFDCQFDDLMNDGEITSLAGQLTRCYSDNKKSHFRAHMVLSSFKGKLKERFETVLTNNHVNWHGVRFLEQHYLEAAERAREWMKDKRGGVIAGALRFKQDSQNRIAKDQPVGSLTHEDDTAVENKMDHLGEVVYLTSDSPNVLHELKPHSTYIIGGLVDKNRHKGICYKRAMDHKVTTARLPIGELMQMQSRAVLATNHVNEIMLKWLELGDWGQAFMQAIPKRKGGVLRNGETEEQSPAKTDSGFESPHSHENGATVMGTEPN